MNPFEHVKVRMQSNRSGSVDYSNESIVCAANNRITDRARQAEAPSTVAVAKEIAREQGFTFCFHVFVFVDVDLVAQGTML